MPVGGIPQTRTALLQILKEDGPMTADELAHRIQLDKRRVVQAAIYRARKLYGTQFFRIVGWVPHRGHGGLQAPLWGPGDASLPDLPRPKVNPLDKNRRYRQTHRAKIKLKDTLRRGGTLNPFSGLMT